MLFLDLHDSTSRENLAGHAGEEFLPFFLRSKGPWPCTGACPWPISSMGPQAQLDSAMTRQHMPGLELLLYAIHRLPIKLTNSPGARDKLLSEQRVSSSLCLKSSEQFLKAQIYILWFWPFFCSLSLLELLPSFMIQAAAHFYLNHSLKHFLCKASGYRWLDMAETAFEFRTRVLFEQIVWGIATFFTTPDRPRSISMQTKIYYSLAIISLFFS